MDEFEVLIVDSPEPESESPLKAFKEANLNKIGWDERVSLIRRQFPSTVKLDWYKVFSEDPATLGKVINDILKIDLAEPGKPGKRPSVDPKVAEERWRQITDEDYTFLSFSEAFKDLVGERSIRAVANKTNLDRNLVYRLLQGSIQPSAAVMEQVAKAFKKQPGYFYEYRVAYIFGILSYKLDASREATVSFYQRVKQYG